MIERLENDVAILERHIHILELVIQGKPIDIGNISDKTHYPHYKIRYSLRVLEEASLIKSSSQGITTTSNTNDFVETLNKKIERIISKMDRMDFKS